MYIYIKYFLFRQCFDDIQGNGTCTCNSSYTGTACELCKPKNNFGLSCDKSKFVYIYICLFVCLFVCLFIHSFNCSFIYLFISLSICSFCPLSFSLSFVIAPSLFFLHYFLPDCTCVHGTCDNGPYGNGTCKAQSCKNGYFGNDCATVMKPCGYSRIPCNINAYCWLKSVIPK